MEEKYIPKIRLFEQRKFGDKFNVTFDFLKENFKPLFKIILLIEAPVILVISFVYTFFMIDMLGISQSAASGGLDPIQVSDRMSSFMSTYSILAVFGVIASTTFFAIVFRYMKLYDSQDPKTITVRSILPTLFKDSAMLFGVYVLYIIVIILGFMFFFIPGLYLAVAFSMAFSIVIFEEENAFQAMSRSISLIRGKWWSTFGLIFVVFAIQMVISGLFYIPLYGVMMAQMFSSFEESQAFERPDDTFIIIQAVLMAIAYLGLFLTNSIGSIAISFQYFNLREKHESVGLMQEIDNLTDDQ